MRSPRIWTPKHRKLILPGVKPSPQSIEVIALCHTCGGKGQAGLHKIQFDSRIGPGNAFSDWLVKHPQGHFTEFLYPQRSGRTDPRGFAHNAWMQYLHNADVKTAYAASAAVTITLASLAASSTLLAGRESTAVDNGASVKYLDYHLAGNYKTAATNLQAGRIRTAVVGDRDDTPTWPDVFDGTDSVETVTVQAMYDSICRVASDIITDATQRTWPYGPVSVASLFGGAIPDQFVVFVSHNAHTSTNAWSATESDHAVKQTGIYATVV